MTIAVEKVRTHYQATGLTERLKTALAVFGSSDQRLTPQQLAPLDQFHTRGLAATADLAVMAGISSGMSVLDVGSGVGGPARFLADTYGCRVTGIDLSPEFVEAATYLTERTGQTGQVTFKVGEALKLPFEDASFDAVTLQHVAMNIADRAGLYAEIRRVLKPDGRFASYDVVARDGEPHYPVPWAKTAETSFLLNERATRDLLENAGFVTVDWKDDTETARTWFAALRGNGPPPGPNLGIVLGTDFALVTGNLGRSIADNRIGILSAVLKVPGGEAISRINKGV